MGRRTREYVLNGFPNLVPAMDLVCLRGSLRIRVRGPRRDMTGLNGGNRSENSIWQVAYVFNLSKPILDENCVLSRM